MARSVTVAGVDSSTQSCKYVVADAATGEIVRSSALPHPEGTEIDPERWWDALQGVGAVDSRDVAALSIAAQQHTTIFLDEEGRPARDAILWNDSRAVPQGLSLRADYGAERWSKTFGLLPSGAHPVSKLRWLAETEPEVAAHVESVMVPHDWLTWRLLGGSRRGAEATTDRSDASGTGYWSPAEELYREDTIRLAFGRSLIVPRVLGPSEAAGTTASGVVVGPGCGDNAAAHLGLGSTFGEAIVSIGTSLTVSTRSTHMVVDPLGHVESMADATGHHLPIVVTLNGARTFAAVGRMLRMSLEELDLLASAGTPDAGGITFLPYLDGERNPLLPSSTGALLGLTRTSMVPENIARAAVLGLACAVAVAIDDLERVGADVHAITVIGGGAQSLALRQAIADLTRQTVGWPRQREFTALGAARQAAWALTGELPPWPIPPREYVTPRPTESWMSEVRDRHDMMTRDVFDAQQTGRQTTKHD